MVFRIFFMVHDTLSIFIKNDNEYLNWSNNAITAEKKIELAVHLLLIAFNVTYLDKWNEQLFVSIN